MASCVVLDTRVVRLNRLNSPFVSPTALPRNIPATPTYSPLGQYPQGGLGLLCCRLWAVLLMQMLRGWNNFPPFVCDVRRVVLLGINRLSFDGDRARLTHHHIGKLVYKSIYELVLAC